MTIARAHRNVDAVFDTGAFIDDVLAFAANEGISRRDLLADADLDLSSGLQVLRGERPPSLLVACALAENCNLSLDEYRMIR